MIKRIGHLEEAVMQRLWDRGQPSSVRSVLEDLQDGRKLAYTTVMTVLDNLHTKGLVSRERQGRAYLYQPALTRAEHTTAQLQDVLDSSDDRSAALLHFVGELSAEDLEELRGELDRRAGSS